MLDLLANGRTKAETLHPSVIRTDGGTQMRAELNPATIDEYAQAMQEGATFPPIIVYYDGSIYWLGDGFHRLAARKRLFEGAIECEVRSGTRRDAVLCAAGANASHGLRRTNADKRRAVETLLRDEEWAQWSDREVARRCGVHHDLVGRIRAESSGGFRQIATERTVERNGTTYTQNTANITVANQERAQAELAEKNRKLEFWLMGKGWSRSSGPEIPTSVNKGEHRFEWDRDDEKGHFNALKNAETIQLAIDMMDRETTRLGNWLIERGWGIDYAPMPKPCYVRKNGARYAFANRYDKAGELAALKGAKAYEEAHGADKTVEMDRLAAEIRDAAALSFQPAPISKEAQTMLNGATSERVFHAQIIVRSIDATLSHMGAYTQMTGKFLHTPPAERALKVMRHELQGLIDALEGKANEYAGGQEVVEEGDEDGE